MASIYYPSSASIYTRIVGTTGLTELNIGVYPNSIFFFTGSFPYTSSIVFFQTADTASNYPITASWSQTASVALNALWYMPTTTMSFVAFHGGFNRIQTQTLYNAVQKLRSGMGGGYV